MTLTPEAPLFEEKVKTDSNKVENIPWYKRTSTRVIGGIATGTIVLGGGAAVVANIPKTQVVDTQPQAQDDQTVDQYSDSNESNEQLDPLTLEDFTLKSEDIAIPAGESAEVVGPKIMDSLTSIINSDSNVELNTYAKQESLTWDVLLPELTAANKKVATDTILVPDWESIDGLKNNFVPTIMNSLDMTSLQFINTAWNKDSKPENIEPYKLWLEPISSEEILDEDPSDNERTIVVTFVNKDNSELNTAEENLTDAQFTYEFKLRSDGTTEKIADVSAR